ncbi:ABC transporter permease [Peribacillus sp. NJ11]|uniref:ABC transporter permease n=1 Tax=Peribacillus sp. NJ11 TaxID=3055861 RepID=UPI0025A30844|nr:ABC transporter permease [Peribacillus sp. NJ11]MDM5224586.1 ABC transporter permease [Peribacillus sp. NJ11]
MKKEANISGNHTVQNVKFKEGLFWQNMKQFQVPIYLFILLFIITAIFAPQFYDMQNIINVLRQASIVGIVAVGMTFVILTAGIDLSVGAVLAFSGVIFASMLSTGYPVWGAILLTLIIGLVVGLVNGIGTSFLGVQPFVMTLATMAILNGAALLITDGTPIDFFVTSSIMELFGNGAILGIPGPVVIFFVGAVIAGLVLKNLPFGRYVYGIGGSLEAARLSGVRTTRVLLTVYAISGLCAAIAGVMTTSRLYVGHPTAGGFIMLDSIAAVVIGGTSLAGGRGHVAGTVAGVILLAMVSNLLNLLGVSPYNQQVAKGVIIIIAVVFTAHGLKDRIKEHWTGL